eukprot:3441766-Amphidinium_carterae.1
MDIEGVGCDAKPQNQFNHQSLLFMREVLQFGLHLMTTSEDQTTSSCQLRASTIGRHSANDPKAG